ncbi:uncharacterized protein BYT42DRAFT_550399 [Radiomyces spectabilis]|uniref:uncharacterized protein n=1 Tax=Radiomyces spectabilis TaxID=64574 RepID=UPI0022206CCA|nr:uncharacterized protein BYT42DRAFT_550399 [Radiomyces spectabilis]KAI8364799.1 hypothetical protein BYT42DRAFT_550399 [Radiomyces spectabilis]
MSSSPSRGVPPPPPLPPSARPMSTTESRRTIPAPPPPSRSPLVRMSTIPVQPSYQTLDISFPEPPQTEAGKWTFHSQREFPPPPPFEKKLRRYPTGAETGCSIAIDLSHLQAYR